jgi:hypothetical protein
MARFFVECPHTPEDCVADLDSVLGHSQELFARFDWGCKEGEHTGWVIVEAQDANTARMLLPISIRQRAKVHGVVKFTPEDVKQFHAALEQKVST